MKNEKQMYIAERNMKCGDSYRIIITDTYAKALSAVRDDYLCLPKRDIDAADNWMICAFDAAYDDPIAHPDEPVLSETVLSIFNARDFQ